MAGNKDGGAKCRDTNLRRNPNFYKEIGRKGGSTPTDKPKGFAADPERARLAGIKGGRISKRERLKGAQHSAEVLAKQELIRAKIALEEIKELAKGLE